MPAVSPFVNPIAWCVVGSIVTVPKRVEPSMNVTVPVGVPLAEVTVAMNATGWPATPGLGNMVSVVLVSAPTRLTVSATTEDVPAAYPVSPL